MTNEHDNMKVLFAIESFIFKCFKLIAETPTTSIRAWVTLILATGTGLKYLGAPPCTIVGSVCVGWEPTLNWLMFIGVLAGADVAQFTAKRVTAWRENPTASENSPPPGANPPPNSNIG